MEKKEYNFTVFIEQDEDGWYVAKVPDLQSCATQGKTVEQAMERIKEAIKACLEEEEPSQLKFVGIQQVAIQV